MVTPSRRVTIYIDGFNLYYALLKPNPAVKWLDVAALGAALRPGDEIKVRYFTARVLPVPDPASGARQRIYLKALETLRPQVTIDYGHFTAHQVRAALVTPPPTGPRTVLVWKTEEKGSDVNIATRLLLDGRDELYEEAVVVSGDSDLVEPIREANHRFGPIHVRNPRDVHSDLALAATSYSRLDPALLPRCQFPDTVQLPSGRSVTRPGRWR
ncbi:MAG TPA: NYN domain-containing protein [Candidatus Limnocylindrales bacterium]|nr:NYN domain-containing protein [Candidatus Limnocylindrales bacterium]